MNTSIRGTYRIDERQQSGISIEGMKDRLWAVAANPDRRYIVHMADRTMLQFDYDLALGRVVTAVLGSDAGSGAWDSLAVVTAESALVLCVHPDTDELIVDFGPAPVLEAGGGP